MGISIELWATHRHTDRSFVPFSGIYPREVVRLTGGLPRQESELARNDREFDKFQFAAPQNDTERVVLHAVNQNPNDCRWQSYLN